MRWKLDFLHGAVVSQRYVARCDDIERARFSRREDCEAFIDHMNNLATHEQPPAQLDIFLTKSDICCLMMGDRRDYKFGEQTVVVRPPDGVSMEDYGYVKKPVPPPDNCPKCGEYQKFVICLTCNPPPNDVFNQRSNPTPAPEPKKTLGQIAFAAYCGPKNSALPGFSDRDWDAKCESIADLVRKRVDISGGLGYLAFTVLWPCSECGFANQHVVIREACYRMGEAIAAEVAKEPKPESQLDKGFHAPDDAFASRILNLEDGKVAVMVSDAKAGREFVIDKSLESDLCDHLMKLVYGEPHPVESDPALASLATCRDSLINLTPEQKRRVLGWLQDEFGEKRTDCIRSTPLVSSGFQGTTGFNIVEANRPE